MNTLAKAIAFAAAANALEINTQFFLDDNDADYVRADRLSDLADGIQELWDTAVAADGDEATNIGNALGALRDALGGYVEDQSNGW